MKNIRWSLRTMFIVVGVIACSVFVIWRALQPSLKQHYTEQYWSNAGAIVLFNQNGEANILVANKNFDGRSFGNLEHYPHFEIIVLHETIVKDRDLKGLRILRSIKTLSLTGTKVTDRGVLVISDLTTLENLFLANTSITDDSVSELAKLRSLKHLDVSHTLISKHGLKQLQESLPNTEIMWK